MNHAAPSVTAARTPRSTFVTVLAWTVIALSTLLLPISFLSLLMVATGSHGSSSADPIGFFIVVLGPLTTLVAGVGLLRRRRWALVYLAMALCGIVVANGFDLARNPSAPRTYVSPGGVPTTVIPAGRDYVVQTSVLIAISAGLLVALLSRKVRGEFGFGTDDRPSSAAAGAPPMSVTGTVGQPPAVGVVGTPPVQTAGPADRERGWRVGHRGRDCMYYEEWREGTWQRLEISGELLTGRAHHVIYFDSPQRWLEYPEWARHRRDEIIARIKGEFRQPDYEYDGDVPHAAAPSPGIAAPNPTAPRPSHRTAATARSGRVKPNAALLIAVTVLLAVTMGMGWLVTSGLSKGETYLPTKRATQRRVVVRQEEPATFWASLGLYSALGAGTLGLAGWLVRESFRQRRPK
ncbi:MAG: hypothetical protein R3F45_10520 [Gammaproteobacteria bacterium]